MIAWGEKTPGIKLASARLRKWVDAHPADWEGGKVGRPEIIEAIRRVAAEAKSSGDRDVKYEGERAMESMSQFTRMQNAGILSMPHLRAALREFLNLRGEKLKEDPIKKMERELVGTKIEGFFPTPPNLVNRVIDAADIQDGMNVLEPSAGKGDLADAAKAKGANVTTAEITHTLQTILKAKGYTPAGDFMDMPVTPDYDRVVMNPPFEKGQDAEHVQRAYEFLKPGGKLVAIVGNGSLSRSDAKAKAFQAWLKSVSATVEELPEGSFSGKDSFRTTGVRTSLVEIDKPKAEEPTKHTPLGADVPTEPTQQSPTATKNAIVEQERAKRGLPPAIEPARREFGRVWDEAMAKIDQNPAIEDELIAELNSHPRAIKDTENALLLHRQIELQNDYAKQTDELAHAYDDSKEFPNRLDDVAELKARVAGISDRLFELYEVNKRVGTETARGLNSRKMMAYEDYSLAQMELGKRAANGGRPLTEDERAQVLDIHQKILKATKDFQDYIAESEKKISDLEAKKALDEVVKTSSPPVEPHIRVIADKIKANAKIRADAALARLKAKWGTERMFSGPIDPTDLDDLAEYGFNKILEHGITGAEMAAEWATDMATTFGEGIKKYLPQIWKAAQGKLDKAVTQAGATTDQAKAKAKRAVKTLSVEERTEAVKARIGKRMAENKLDSITGSIQQLARLMVEDGVSDRNELIDRIHEFLQQLDPEITRREAMDAISGYGKFKQLTKDQVSVELRDLKGQMQQVAKLEDMQAGEPPKKTGLERRIPSKEESRLIKAVNEAKRKFQIPITDPNTQLKSALDTLKTRMQTRIDELNEKLANQDFSARPAREAIKLDAKGFGFTRKT